LRLGKKKQYSLLPAKAGTERMLSEPDEVADKMMDALELNQCEMKSQAV